ncbi:FUSC family protein [Aeromicrobium ginsengisoli]|uniref:FUSC family protein n=1 Tax=Aeromicrobium ginsengisoli TaxID=363867 RepID=A0A5M4FCA4_9ACTN|nr:FUSC family protein [Aeromicrobium ginsengisoli]KAA1396034.1 FUSC family protein [Aeromicrobium ginsengisoli]
MRDPRPARAVRWRPSTDLVSATVTMTAVLGTFGTTLALSKVADFGATLTVLSVVLSLTLGRLEGHGSWRSRGVRLATLVVVAIAARYVAEIMFHHDVLGGALLAVGLSAPILLRRLGTVASRLGSLMSLPFVAVLTTPAVAGPADHDAWWAPVIAVVAYAWVVAATTVAHLLGLLHEAPPSPVRPPTGRVLDASARMAIQMLVSLSLALLVGHVAFDEHWPWVVITAFVVNSGNRGRGDVLAKSVLRVLGALVGTTAATLIAGRVTPGSHASVVAIFVVLAIGTWLRPRGYAYWAGCVTAVLALLYGYYGTGQDSQLEVRLLAIVIGGVIAVVVSWFLLPIRTRDVARRRVAGVLAAVQDVVSARLAGDEPDVTALRASRRDLELIRPTWHLHSRLGRATTAPAHALDAVLAVADAAAELGPAPRRAPLGQAARDLGSVRRLLRGSDHVTGLTPDLVAIAARLREASAQA